MMLNLRNFILIMLADFLQYSNLIDLRLKPTEIPLACMNRIYEVY